MTGRAIVEPAASALFTDLYELTMAQVYHDKGIEKQAAFELFFRNLTHARNYVVACGLNTILEYLEDWHFTADELDYLRSLDRFSDELLERLARMRFRGDVDALPEGTLVFPHEPVVRVRAPIIEAQIIETFLLTQLDFQSLTASKAARMVTAAGGRPVVDFGARRAHGTDAAVKAARASYIVGAVGTSNMVAGQHYGIPVYGTMAHSFIQCHSNEKEALRDFTEVWPETTLLVDTYDTIAAVGKVVELAREMGDAFRVQSIRIDSGDLVNLSKRARRILDKAGLHGVKIMVSGGLDEHRIEQLLAEKAPIDGFGVGASLVVSPDVPDLDFAYKLVEYDGQPRMKLSTSKDTLPGPKQVFRTLRDGRLQCDVLARADEKLDGEPQLVPVMRRGRRLPGTGPSLSGIREYAAMQLERLPEEMRSLAKQHPEYEVQVSRKLAEDRERLQRELAPH